MNIALLYDDRSRYFTVGSYVTKELANQNDINIVAHCRIPEDAGVLEEQYTPNLDLILVIDSSTHYKIHHHRGKLSKNTKTCFWISDLHRPDWAKWRLQMIKEWHYDHIFYAQKNFKQMIMDCGYEESECTWLLHAADSEIFKPLFYISKQYDIGYVGYMNDKREKAERILKNYMRFKHYSSVWAWSACRAMNECKILFNISVENDINMRVFESLATGIPLLTNYTDNGFDDIFGNEEEFCLTYNDETEMKEKAVRLLANPEMRKTLGKKGRDHVLKHHTYRNRINSILGIMGFPLLKNYG